MLLYFGIALVIAFLFRASGIFAGILGGIAYWLVGLFSPSLAIGAGIAIGVIFWMVTPSVNKMQ
ncbi:MAG: hypothetical protein SPJ58_09750 [Actinobacillus porcinus]|nr:hypothetical protein [Actinobacillus porcinus]MDY5848941.1 hypothetical protein [Actinobacillus porcinus]